MEIKPCSQILIPGATDPDWSNALDSLEFKINLEKRDRDAFQDLADLHDKAWTLALGWLFKLRWDSKYKIPARRKLVRLYKPFGEELNTLVEITKELHPEVSEHYRSFPEWFLMLCNEKRKNDLCNAWTRLTDKGYGVKGKTYAIRDRSGDLRKLRAGQNIYDSEQWPLWYEFTELCLSREKDSPVFKNRYWKPYLGACSKHLRQRSKPDFQGLVLDNGTLRQRSGPGNGTLLFLNQRPKALPDKDCKP